ncbi:MAG: hypothetical protein GSR86_03050 [Desulfurococcales archaeon]|nr:hypothetical protein [Desulfurococcales archaeon]
MHGELDPIDRDFIELIQEIYWMEPLSEAEEALARRLEEMDEDLRQLLLERRRKLCSNHNNVLEVVRLEAMAETADTEILSKLLLARSLLGAGFLMQCTRSWSNLSPRDKAWILAPLYKAAHGLDLAVKNWPERLDEAHLNYAIEMLDKALERAQRLGIMDELRDFIESVMEKVIGAGE